MGEYIINEEELMPFLPNPKWIRAGHKQIVRCGECRFWKQYGNSGLHFCQRVRKEWQPAFNAEDYCSRGKRKNE